MNLPHLPALRRGKPYASLDTVEVLNHRTGEPMARVSQVGAGIVRKDLGRIGEARAALKKFSTEELIAISAKAGEFFLGGTLPFGDAGHTQSAEDYVRTLSATSGLPHVMVRRNMAKIHFALTNVRTVLNGLTRGLPLDVLDRGYGGSGATGPRICASASAISAAYLGTTTALAFTHERPPLSEIELTMRSR